MLTVSNHCLHSTYVQPIKKNMKIKSDKVTHKEKFVFTYRGKIKDGRRED